MSITLDSPMETIAIIYFKNQAFLTTSVWAWIAFLTAAISFSWKIKSSIHSSFSLPHHHLSFTSSSSSSSSSNEEPTKLDDHEVPATTTFCRLENRRSGKFSFHYGQVDDNIINNIDNEEYLLGTFRSHQEDEEERGMRVDDDDDDDDDDEELMMMTMGTSIIKHVGYWESDDVVLVKMKIREMGWYSYQDLSVLDGNVVRLWTDQIIS